MTNLLSRLSLITLQRPLFRRSRYGLAATCHTMNTFFGGGNIPARSLDETHDQTGQAYYTGNIRLMYHCWRRI